jgi:hypothetical protein
MALATLPACQSLRIAGKRDKLVAHRTPPPLSTFRALDFVAANHPGEISSLVFA